MSKYIRRDELVPFLKNLGVTMEPGSRWTQQGNDPNATQRPARYGNVPVTVYYATSSDFHSAGVEVVGATGEYNVMATPLMTLEYYQREHPKDSQEPAFDDDGMPDGWRAHVNLAGWLSSQVRYDWSGRGTAG